MANYPIYRKSSGTGEYFCILSPSRTLTVYKKNGDVLLKSITSKYFGLKTSRNRSLKQITSKQFYDQYLKVRRSLNKQCIMLIKALNKN